MRKKENFFLAFFVFLFLSILVFGLSKTGILSPVTSVFQKVISPFSQSSYNLFNSFEFLGTNSKIKKLKNENLNLASKLSDQKKLERENMALSDQFQTNYPRSSSLLSANIVGAPGFIPGFSVPETLIIDRGTSDGVKLGDAVVFKNNLVGKITNINNYFSQVTLVTNTNSSFTTKTSSQNLVLGVVKGQGGGQILLDNVLLSDTINVGDLVMTNGDTNINGGGYPPDLVVGKVISVDKRPSELFQRAQVQSFLEFSKLTTVFIMK